MRRFEFVEGSSAKFWSGFVEGTTFTVLFGRIGTAGQRKDKAFPTEEAARKELEKKTAEKLREGYKEVAAEGEAPAPAVAAPAPEKKRAAPPLPPRLKPRPATPERTEAALQALALLSSRLGGRGWQVAQAARRARRALAAMAGARPTGPLQGALEALLGQVEGPRGGRLPLRLAFELLGQLDAAVLDRALELWAASKDPRIALLRARREGLGDAELALRFGGLLCERPERGGSEAGFLRRWQALRPHLSGRLDLASLGEGEGALRRTLERLRAAA